VTGHPIIEQHPAWQSWLEERRDLAARRDAVAQQQLAESAHNDRELGRHRAETAAAVAAGKPVPPSPALHDLARFDHVVAELVAAEMAHQKRQTAVLAVVAETGVDGCRERLRLGVAAAADTLATADAARQDAVATLRTYARLLAAADEAAGLVVRPRRADRVPQQLTLDEFAQAARGEIDLAVVPDPSQLGPPQLGATIVLDQAAYDRLRHAPEQVSTLTPREHNERMMRNALDWDRRQQQQRELGVFPEMEQQQEAARAQAIAERDHRERVRNDDIGEPDLGHVQMRDTATKTAPPPARTDGPDRRSDRAGKTANGR
jgi:hypothetical protein